MGSRTDERQEYGILNGSEAFQSVADKLFQEGYRFSFFQAVSLLEKLYRDSAPPGELGPLGQETVRFRANTRSIFPASDVSRIKKINSEYIQKVTQNPEIIQMVLTFMGLYGVNSPLPPYFSEIVAEVTDDEEIYEEGAEDGINALKHLLDIFDHRIYSFYYRSWKKYRYYLHYKPGARDRFSQYMLSLIGLGTPDLQGLVGVEVPRLLAYAGILSQQTRCAEGLRSLLSDYFGGIEVGTIEFMPRWAVLPLQYRTRIGGNGVPARLGENVTIGRKMRDFSGKFRIVLGPLTFEAFRRFLPGGTDSKILYLLIRFYVLNQLSFDVELLLRKEDVPPLQLGSGFAQLGWVSWLGRPSKDIVSVVFSLDRRHGN